MLYSNWLHLTNGRTETRRVMSSIRVSYSLYSGFESQTRKRILLLKVSVVFLRPFRQMLATSHDRFHVLPIRIIFVWSYITCCVDKEDDERQKGKEKRGSRYRPISRLLMCVFHHRHNSLAPSFGDCDTSCRPACRYNTTDRFWKVRPQTSIEETRYLRSDEKFEVFMAVKTRDEVFWVVTPCSVARSSEILVSYHITTQMTTTWTFYCSCRYVM
jgi:hypothetical protein